MTVDVYANVRPDVGHACAQHGIVGSGPSNADVMCIGIAPGNDEWRNTRRPFTGAAGRLLDATLRVCGWERSRTYTTNLICWWKNDPNDFEILECWARLEAEIRSVAPRLIVTCGEIASSWFARLTEHGGRKFGTLRGGVFWMERYGCWWMPTYHPAAFLYGDSFVDIADFGRDLYKIADVVSWPLDSQWGAVPYMVAENADEADEWLWGVTGLCAIDVECTYDGKRARYEDSVSGLARYQDSALLCFSVASAWGTMVIPGNIAPLVRPGWGSRDAVQWITHGGMFDRIRLRQLLGERITIAHDTLLQSYAVDERGGRAEENDRAVGIHGLKQLAREYCAAGFYDVSVLGVGPDELHAYNACDSAYTLRLHSRLAGRQRADGVWDGFYPDLLIPAIGVLGDAQEYGVAVDRDVMLDFGVRWAERWLQMHDDLVTEARALGWEGDINLNSSPQILRMAYEVMGLPVQKHNKTGRPTTDKDAMETLVKLSPWCARLLEWRALDHMIKNYVVGIQDDIKFDGLLHPEPLLHGTRSGRTSYHKPPIQTIPNKGVDPEMAKLRRMYVARPGKVLLEADYKQAEFWSMYLISRDEALLTELQTGDIHGRAAIDTFGVGPENEHFPILRFMSKTFNFGILYGRQAESMAESMWRGRAPPAAIAEGLIKWDVHEARRYIQKWERNHSGVVKWRREEIQRAMRNGEQQSVTGRKRRYWMPNFKVLTQSINFQPQCIAHEHLLASLVELGPLVTEYDSHFLFEVHDALLFEVDSRWLPEVSRLVKRVMERPKFGFDYGIPVDISVGNNWYDVAQYEVSE